MRRAFTLVEFVVAIGIILVLAVFLAPVLITGHHTPSRRGICQSNLKQGGLGMLQYVQDYDERFPPARITSTTGWADGIYPYIKSRQVFQCPATQNRQASLTDYFYNRRLARYHREKIRFATTTLLCGDGDDDAPAWNSLSGLPVRWRTSNESPSQRHLDAANYLFVDGHVKSLRPNQISNAASNKATATFAIR